MAGVDDFEKHDTIDDTHRSTSSNRVYQNAPVVGNVETRSQTEYFVVDTTGIDDRDTALVDLLKCYADNQGRQPTGHTRNFTIRWTERRPSDSDHETASTMCHEATVGSAEVGAETDSCVVDATGVEKQDRSVIDFLKHLAKQLGPRPTGCTKSFTIRWMERPPPISVAMETESERRPPAGRYRPRRAPPQSCPPAPRRGLGGDIGFSTVQDEENKPAPVKNAQCAVLEMPPEVPPPPEPHI